jgi:hypothetical protein
LKRVMSMRMMRTGITQIESFSMALYPMKAVEIIRMPPTMIGTHLATDAESFDRILTAPWIACPKTSSWMLNHPKVPMMSRTAMRWFPWRPKANFDVMAVDMRVCAPITPVAMEMTVRMAPPMRAAKIAAPSFALAAMMPPSMKAGMQTEIPQMTIPMPNQVFVFSIGTGLVP